MHPFQTTPLRTGALNVSVRRNRGRLQLTLLARNRVVEHTLFHDSQEFYKAGDFRWFFTLAHAHITRQINSNLNLFQRPNALLRLNLHFAEEFIRALNGQPHEGWRRAFQFCKALEKASNDTSMMVGEVEFCGARMANVHIHVDLSSALSDVGRIPPEDLCQRSGLRKSRCFVGHRRTPRQVHWSE